VVESIFWFVWATGTADLPGIWAEILQIEELSPAIWTTSHSRDTFYPSYTPPDGPEQEMVEATVVENWFAELERLAPTNGQRQ